MEYIVICTAAVVVSGLTLFSGFGLGTLLMPAFAVFFPVEVAIAMTGVVHLLNNIFKFILLGKHADKGVFLRFGLPAIPAAFVGAWLLLGLTRLEPIYVYQVAGKEFQITPVKLVIAVFMVVFALTELGALLKRLSIPRSWLPVGGVLSGFFGGVSGHQGALRSAFLLKCGLRKESFIATGVVISCLVDVTRLGIYYLGYSQRFAAVRLEADLSLLAAATGAAFVGAFIGNRLIKKVTLRAVQIIVAVMLLGIAVSLGLGII
jgi:uncharacterized membrane protein YfcA